MADISYIFATILFFTVALSYTAGCDRLRTKEKK